MTLMQCNSVLPVCHNCVPVTTDGPLRDLTTHPAAGTGTCRDVLALSLHPSNTTSWYLHCTHTRTVSNRLQCDTWGPFLALSALFLLCYQCLIASYTLQPFSTDSHITCISFMIFNFASLMHQLGPAFSVRAFSASPLG